MVDKRLELESIQELAKQKISEQKRIWMLGNISNSVKVLNLLIKFINTCFVG
jgi:hypothetical protein